MRTILSFSSLTLLITAFAAAQVPAARDSAVADTALKLPPKVCLTTVALNKPPAWHYRPADTLRVAPLFTWLFAVTYNSLVEDYEWHNPLPPHLRPPLRSTDDYGYLWKGCFGSSCVASHSSGH